MDKKKYDIVIIGGGPAGYVAGIRANQLGLSSCIIEADKPGGVCLNMGCIPSKALIHQAEVFTSLKEAEGLGITVDRSGFDYRKVFQKSRKAADSLSKGVSFLLKKNNIALVSDRGTISSPTTVSLGGGGEVEGRFILVTTGSRPREIPGFEFDEEQVLSSNGALLLEKLPRSLIILGAGAIGCEFAHIMNAFGVEVTLVEMLEQILPQEDPEIADVLAKSFKRRKIGMINSGKASNLRKNEQGVTIDVETGKGKEKLGAEKILVVAGRVPNTDALGLDTVGITLEKGFIPVGDYYRTSAETVYAAGDVVDSPLLAHVASKEAEIAVEHMASAVSQSPGALPVKKIDPLLIPSAVYTDPEIAGFGMTEKEAGEKGREAKSVTFPFRGAGRAVAVEKSDGMVKIIYDVKTKEILGGRIAGAQATDLIHELLLAKSAELLPEDIASMIHAHPTLSEAVMEAARGVDGWMIHG